MHSLGPFARTQMMTRQLAGIVMLSIGAVLASSRAVHAQLKYDSISVGEREFIRLFRQPMRLAMAQSYAYGASYQVSGGNLPHLTFSCSAISRQIEIYVVYAHAFTHVDSVTFLFAVPSGMNGGPLFAGSRLDVSDTEFEVQDTVLVALQELFESTHRELKSEQFYVTPVLGMQEFVTHRTAATAKLLKKFYEVCKRDVWGH